MLLPVKDNGVRPAGDPHKCFYCGQEITQPHKEDCVCRERTIVLRLSLEYVVAVPAYYTEKDILFHRNEGTFCMDNDIDRMKVDGCFCAASDVAYVREATEEDMRNLPNAMVEDDQ